VEHQDLYVYLSKLDSKVRTKIIYNFYFGIKNMEVNSPDVVVEENKMILIDMRYNDFMTLDFELGVIYFGRPVEELFMLTTAPTRHKKDMDIAELKAFIRNIKINDIKDV
jgi:hypothetical protein